MAVALLLLVVAMAGTGIAATSLMATTGKARVTNWASRITTPETPGPEERFGKGARILEVPQIAKLTVRVCDRESARLEVTSLSGSTSRTISSQPSITYAQFKPAEGGSFSVLEGPGWKPFVIDDQENNVEDQIAIFRVESGTGAGTTVADFRVVAMHVGVASATECTYSATAQVYKG
jgi:hypothetical protein